MITYHTYKLWYPKDYLNLTDSVSIRFGYDPNQTKTQLLYPKDYLNPAESESKEAIIHLFRCTLTQPIRNKIY